MSVTMESRVMVITPKAAKEFLEKRNATNRRLRPAHVANLAEAMRRGEWTVTHQGIAISRSGYLLDGQHRLAAVVMYGKPVRMMVTTNVPDDAFDAVDVGARRSPSDLLGIAGLDNAAIRAASARLVIGYDEMRDRIWAGPAYNALFSGRRVVDWNVEHEAEMTSAVTLAHPVYRANHLRPAVAVAGVFLIARVTTRDQALEDFVGGITTGENLARGDARLAFRNVVLGPKTRGGTRTSQWLLALMLKAWNGYAQGRTVHLLKWLSSEPMPDLEE